MHSAARRDGPDCRVGYRGQNARTQHRRSHRDSGGGVADRPHRRLRDRLALRALAAAALRSSIFCITETRIKLGQYLFLKHGAAIIIIAQFIPVMRAIAGVLAGANRMPWRRFVLSSAIGVTLWATAFGIGGYTFGVQFARLAHSWWLFSGPSGWVVFGIGAVIVIWILAVVRRPARGAVGRQGRARPAGATARAVKKRHGRILVDDRLRCARQRTRHAGAVALSRRPMARQRHRPRSEFPGVRSTTRRMPR